VYCHNFYSLLRSADLAVRLVLVLFGFRSSKWRCGSDHHLYYIGTSIGDFWNRWNHCCDKEYGNSSVVSFDCDDHYDYHWNSSNHFNHRQEI